ncbi:hypothetical protein KNU78_gp81 [Gordonia phage Sukkupi]|uniref:Uncharacterized protein n=1 Tax=Gordonia phage Sukkupi TaxID=2653747 RepID=A0A5Q2WLH4_9CAUD|nr:hypothetical protein KNU78_gp81 [Gordonia phage Sukkupi]QGH79324.1 hypothetical protein SEA_SUKKUPI_81 [Gordonia phage Sukkupi]QGH80796.1 hypothetical protein SEA_YNDEXA_81 [Gordonia phage Yndexa]
MSAPGARLAQRLTAAGYRRADAAAWSADGEVWETVASSRYGYAITTRVEISRDRRGRVTRAAYIDGDGRRYPFGPRRVVGELLDYLAGVRFDVATWNGAYPTFGVAYGPASVTTVATRRHARALRETRAANGDQVTLRRVDPAGYRARVTP